MAGRAAALALLLLAGGARAADGIVVASKIDTEGAILGSLIAQTLARAGIKVTERLQLGPTQIVRSALLEGQIDLYPEYTGNGAFFFHQETDPVWRDAEAGYGRVAALDRAANHLVWLTPAPADNSWAIAASEGLAARLSAPSVEALARYLATGGRIRLAASAEFADNDGGLPAFEAAYGFHLSGDELLVLSGGNTAATIRAAALGISGVDAAMAYGTDGALAALNVVPLDDPRHSQPVFAPAPVIGEAALRRFPATEALLAPIFKTLTLDRLRHLNARVAVDGEEAGAVARDYLDHLGQGS